jgi:hypothetical protein
VEIPPWVISQLFSLFSLFYNKNKFQVLFS